MEWNGMDAFAPGGHRPFTFWVSPVVRCWLGVSEPGKKGCDWSLGTSKARFFFQLPEIHTSSFFPPFFSVFARLKINTANALARPSLTPSPFFALFSFFLLLGSRKKFASSAHLISENKMLLLFLLLGNNFFSREKKSVLKRSGVVLFSARVVFRLGKQKWMHFLIPTF